MCVVALYSTVRTGVLRIFDRMRIREDTPLRVKLSTMGGYCTYWRSTVVSSSSRLQHQHAGSVQHLTSKVKSTVHYKTLLVTPSGSAARSSLAANRPVSETTDVSDKNRFSYVCCVILSLCQIVHLRTVGKGTISLREDIGFSTYFMRTQS